MSANGNLYHGLVFPRSFAFAKVDLRHFGFLRDCGLVTLCDIEDRVAFVRARIPVRLSTDCSDISYLTFDLSLDCIPGKTQPVSIRGRRLYWRRPLQNAGIEVEHWDIISKFYSQNPTFRTGTAVEITTV